MPRCIARYWRRFPRLDSGKPLLNYVVTYFGHWDYPLRGNAPRYRDRSSVPEVGSYANTAHYKARELMAFLRELRQRDPDALIVIFGDHPPYLGPNFAGYVESGLLADDRTRFTPEMFRGLQRGALIVIDGERDHRSQVPWRSTNCRLDCWPCCSWIPRHMALTLPRAGHHVRARYRECITWSQTRGRSKRYASSRPGQRAAPTARPGSGRVHHQ